MFRKVQELIAKGGVKVISLEISSEVAIYLLNHKFDAITELKEKYQVEFKFNSKPGLVFENFKIEILETKENEDDEEYKSLNKRLDKESPKEEVLDSKSSLKKNINKKGDSEKGSNPTKRHYSKRKPVSRRSQARGRGRKPYNSRKKPDGEISTTNNDEQISDSIKKPDFNTVSDMVDSPIIPLPAPYVRPKADSELQLPDENINEG